MNPQMSPLLIDIFRLCVWLIGLVVLFVPLERFFAVYPHKLLRKGMVTDLGYYFLNSLLPAVLLGLPIGALAWAAHRVVPGSFLEATAALPFWARALAAFVAGEVGYYWGHRWSHEIPLLWRFHSIHHSAEEMDFLVHTRAHPVDMVFGRFCALVPIYLLGLSGPAKSEGSTVIVVVMLIATTWGFFIHANLRWRFGLLEWLVSTPAFHHWHHTKSGPINRNYSSNFPWLDWIFGSLYLPKEWPADYGIKTKLPDALVDQLVYPLFPPAPERVEPAKAVAATRATEGPENHPAFRARPEGLST
jgi:sterol desaturase/sphingolipid hydroxylase (fatty acid hydroxylase superfamily)